MIKITGLWSNTDKNGNTYLSGKLGDANIKIFANNYKQEDKHPDMIMYLDESKKKTEQKQEQQQQGEFYTVDNEDELPF